MQNGVQRGGTDYFDWINREAALFNVERRREKAALDQMRFEPVESSQELTESTQQAGESDELQDLEVHAGNH